MTIEQRAEFVSHLNRLAMMLGYNIVYDVGIEEEDEHGFPNMQYYVTTNNVTFAWLPEGYAEDNLREYIEAAEEKFEEASSDNIKRVIREAELFCQSL